MTPPELAGSGVPRWPSVTRWALACAGAEAIGMVAAAGAARLGDALLPVPRGGLASAGALLLIVAGGLAEGAALGTLQALALVRRASGFRPTRWVWATLVVAGLGWAAASAPAALAPADGGLGDPPRMVIAAAALALGAAMGTILGAAQAAALSRTVAHRWRWIGISAIAWAPAMALIFLGATLPDAGWPVLGVLATAALTGGAAGAVLGALSGALFTVLDARTWSDGIVAGVLRSPANGLLAGSLVLLEFRGRRTGAVREIPVQYARSGELLVVVPGDPGRKQWWRSLRTPAPVRALLRGGWRAATVSVLEPSTPGYYLAARIYDGRWRSRRPRKHAVIVRLELSPPPDQDQRPFPAGRRDGDAVATNRRPAETKGVHP